LITIAASFWEGTPESLSALDNTSSTPVALA
jgi:hypothetical protein